ncbi:hypothetical protein BG006_002201 [Podila minutissima]|uniref:Initiator tRNA phosphoribosyl transferase n=1 Tax=Podila minutissima TaxID=64525 RepID=A0A9P5VQT8_9FUNG|nr:hypothetical protein BG006_002201 [Podila minutissima]
MSAVHGATQIAGHARNRDDMRREAKSLMNRLKSIQADAAFPTNAVVLGQVSTSNPRMATLASGILTFDAIIHTSSPKSSNTEVRKRALLDLRNQQKKDQEPQENGQHASHDVVMNEDQGSTTRVCNGTKDSIAGECVENTAQTASLLVPALDAEKWDTRYHSLPSLISRSEHAQIAEKIDGFAEKLMRFTDLSPLTTKLLKPIRPIWLTPQSFLFKNDPPDYSQVGFFPVICLSASRVVPEGMEEQDGYLYVQGSGDDEEMWSKGLRPDLFWDNVDWLLEDGISPAECENRAKQVVLEAKKKQLEQSRHDLSVPKAQGGKHKGEHAATGHVVFTPSMEICSEIKPSPIWIGNNASGRVPDAWEAGFDMVINCGAEIQRDPLFEHGAHVVELEGVGQGGVQATLCVLQKHQWEAISSSASTLHETPDASRHTPPRTEGGRDYFYLHLPIAEGKKGQHQLLTMIPVAIQAVNEMYSCSEGLSPSRILVHCQQGMDRSVGISLSLLVACFDEDGGQFQARTSSLAGLTATKEMIQKRLFQIMSHRLAARPSRATLKIVNTFFMSPTDPPPAKYKQ